MGSGFVVDVADEVEIVVIARVYRTTLQATFPT